MGRSGLQVFSDWEVVRGFSQDFPEVVTENKGSKETDTLQSWEVGAWWGVPSDSGTET